MDLGLNYQVTYAVCKRTLTIDIHVSGIYFFESAEILHAAMNESNVQPFASHAKDWVFESKPRNT